MSALGTTLHPPRFHFVRAYERKEYRYLEEEGGRREVQGSRRKAESSQLKTERGNVLRSLRLRRYA